jgi:PAS domain S-box-containing protein
MTPKQEKIRQFGIFGKYFPYAVFICCLLGVFLVWIAEISLRDLKPGIASLKDIHRNPSVWLINLLPFIFFAATWLYIRAREASHNSFTRKLKEKERILRKYAEVARRLGRGEYSFPVAPEGESDVLGSSLQLLQGSLKAGQRKETEQSWISEGKELVSRILRINNQLDTLAYQTLKSLSDYLNTQQAAFYTYNAHEKTLTCIATYAYNRRKYLNQVFRLGEGLVGQCAYEMDYVYRTEIPEDYLTISSGIMGDRKPASILLIPLITDDQLQGVMEFASLQPKFPKLSIQFLLELGEIIARTVYNLNINKRTESLLEESRKMTAELTKNDKALRENDALMRITQEELKRSNEQLETKIREVENAQGKLHWLLENSSEIIAIYSGDILMKYISPSVTRILGYTPEEMMQGKDFERISHEGASELKKLILDSVSEPDLQRTIQYSFITKEGERIFLESTAKNLLGDEAIAGIIINSRDITEKIRAEREERLKSRMQSLSENSLDMIMRLSVSGQLFYANPVVEDYVGIEAAQLLNKNLSELEIVSALKDYLKDALSVIIPKPQKINREVAIPIKMGEKLTERILSIDAIPEFNQGELETILFVGHDVTESKRIQKEIQVKNKNIEDSINYALRIQSSLLPNIDNVKSALPKSFIYFKPRDVISGDFPWFYATGEDIYIAAVDCTGHGVPGALLSFIGFFLMKEVVHDARTKNAGQICDLIHTNFRDTLRQNTDRADSRDGMDLALCKINLHKKTLDYAGAHRPLYLLSDGELTEYPGDRKSIGGIPLLKKVEENFTNHSISFHPGDKIFFFTDGLTDQLGGPYGRKYSTNRLRERILENQRLPMSKYHELFENDFADWQKGFKQLDDVLMIGIEF